ncbi:MAG: TonB-dependent hemoglobin/transferrin/lactoferrin family receptor [Algicola sp.]|nr:TonB-dependent hemoglobin/transferrin/lactoferrin family receptor [Algicola sp.]
MKTLKLTPLAVGILLAVTTNTNAEQLDDKPVERTYLLNKVTVAATLSEEKVNDVAGNVSVISAQDLLDNGATNIADMVRYQPGVEVAVQAGQGGRFGLKGMNIRGMDENRVKIVVDGVDQADAFAPAGSPYQRAGRNYVDIDSMKQIEIVKGPASSLYGSDAIGGVVAFTTKDPADVLAAGDNTAGSAKIQYHSVDNTQTESFTIANRTGQLESLLVYTRRNGEAVENHSDSEKPDPLDFESDNILAKLQYQANEQHRFGFTAERFESYTETDVQSQLGGSYSEYYIGKDTVSRDRYGLSHLWQADNALFDKMKLTLDVQKSESAQDTHHVYRDARRIKDYNHSEDNKTLAAQFDLTRDNHYITYGFNIEHSDVANTTDTLYLDSPERNTYNRYVPLVEQKSRTLFLQDKISLLNDKLLITPGLGYSKFDAKPKIDEQFAAPEVINEALTDHASSKVTGRLGAVYKLVDGYTLFGQYSQGFKSPQIIDSYYGSHRNYGPGYNYLSLPNAALKPEQSDSFEFGLRANGDHGDLEVTVFYNDYQDFIEQATLDNSYNGQTYDSVTQNVNLDEVKISGIELRSAIWLDTAINAPQGTSLNLAIAYAKGENKTNDQPLDSISPLKAVFGLNYDNVDANWGGAVNWTLTSKKDSEDVSDETLATTAGYGIVDLSGYYLLGENWQLRAGIYNLTDKKYSVWESIRGLSADSDSLSRYTRPGRNFALNVGFEF